MNNKLLDELRFFKDLWKDGYYEGDPLNPLTKSSYGRWNYMSVLHATYLRCIKPYVNSETIALEIGPGKGAWTKALLPSKEIWVLDALSAEHNCFFEYLNNPNNVKYYQISDFSCNILPDNYFTYMFSYGCLCHVSFQGITEYAINIYDKMKKGSNCFWMIADYDKYNSAIIKDKYINIWKNIIPPQNKYAPLKYLLSLASALKYKKELLKEDIDNNPKPGRWYNAGIKRTCDMLQNAGYEIVDQDVETNYRDPIIHFKKV